MKMYDNNAYYEMLAQNESVTVEHITTLKKLDREEKYSEYDRKHGNPVYRNAITGELTDKADPDKTVVGYSSPLETSLDMLRESGTSIEKYEVDNFRNPLEVLIRKERNEELHDCIKLLTSEEQELIQALFWEEMTEAEYGKRVGLSRTGVSYRKQLALSKLKKQLMKGKVFGEHQST
jgi:RNA polymerase sigma factor (sigma-70 family)